MSGEGNFIFGVNPVLEKIKAAPHEIDEIVLADKALRPVLREIEKHARDRGIRLAYRPTGVLDRLAGGPKHQGVVAAVRPYAYLSFEALLDGVAGADAEHRVLALDGVTDPRNLGALLRSAEAFGVRHVVLPKDRSAAISPAVVKASAGAVHHLRVCRVPNLRRALVALKERGFWVVGLDPGASESLFEPTFPERLAIVVGSEGSGIRRLVLESCDFRVAIPMRGKVGSLNVAVAGGIFLYELFRRSLR
ncbi:MAG TPA: 23S rRNA (guanosine(2251)-2'-O)-methyltransferase RlmB [Candidatus Eisenbacteria bacterium]|nr:23S rRNA (guanosine(2251)-2'-O)-methyltransferase RlmB [Candidatus Eisenbacteria bacterium]